MRRALPVFLAMMAGFWLLPPHAYGADSGERSAAFLRLGVGARGLGLAGAHGASASGAESLFWNPAGLGDSEFPQISLSYNPLVEDVKAAHAGGVMPFKKGAVGLGFFTLQHDPIDGFDDVGNATGEFDASDSVALLSYQRGSRAFSWALTGKFIRSDIADESASAAAADAGLRLENPWSEKIVHSLVIKNIGTGLKFIDKEEDLPEAFLTGVSFHLIPSLRWNLEGGIDAGAAGGMSGMEWRPFASGKDVLALRGGYSTFRNEIDGLSGAAFGAGFFIGSAEWDYAWIPFGELGHSHSVSLTWTFGQKASAPALQPAQAAPVKPREIGDFADGAWIEMNDGRRFQGRILKETTHFFILGTREGKRKVRKDRIKRLRRIPIRVKGNLGSME